MCRARRFRPIRALAKHDVMELSCSVVASGIASSGEQLALVNSIGAKWSVVRLVVDLIVVISGIC